MNNEERKEYIDEVQKDIVQVCFKQCFDIKKLDYTEECTEQCYKNYLQTLRDVAFTLRDIGYNNQSLYAYKAFPYYNPRFKYIYNEQTMRPYNQFPYAYDQLFDRKQ